MTETTSPRTLVLARHARADNNSSSDEARELSPRGYEDAAAVGRWLIEAGYNFGVVVCSTSTRTRQTWEAIRAAGVPAEDVRFDQRAYGADPAALLDILAGIPAQVTSVLVVGHAPTIPELTDQLADPETSDQIALESLRSGFPSGCLAVLRVNGGWNLTPRSATLIEVTSPRA